MKKAVPIFLAFLILYNVLGYLIVFKTFQYSIRNEVRQKIVNSVPENELIVIRLTNAEMKSGKNGYAKTDNMEFSLAGKMYDIVRSKTEGDTNILYCINDTKEESLFANLDAHVKRYMESNIPLKQKSNTLFQVIVTQAILQKKSPFMQNESAYEYVFSFSEKLNSTFIHIPSPPPKNIL